MIRPAYRDDTLGRNFKAYAPIVDRLLTTRFQECSRSSRLECASKLTRIIDCHTCAIFIFIFYSKLLMTALSEINKTISVSLKKIGAKKKEGAVA